MRKILTFTRYGITATTAVARRAAITALGFSLAVTFAWSSASAQTPAQTLAPTATSGVRDAALVSWSGAGGSSLADVPTVDASYSLLGDNTQVQQAAHLGGAGRPYPTGMDVCNTGCDVSYYVNYDALWLRRENDERFSMTRNFFMPDFQYEFGGRYTVGRLLDCVNGWEAVYAGPFDWQRSRTIFGPGNLTSNFVPRLPYNGGHVDAFNDADQHVQAYRAQLNSFELNRRWWTWDVLSTMIGVRYVDYEEDYAFLSQRNTVGTGRFQEGMDNQLLGAQVGADILYPVSLRTNVGFRVKGGVYANFEERTTFLNNNGTVLINAGDTDTDWAGVIEGGIFTNYQVVPSVRLTAGYEFWYLPGVATIPEQAPHIIHPQSGTSISNDSDLFLHGGSVGLQILF